MMIAYGGILVIITLLERNWLIIIATNDKMARSIALYDSIIKV